MSQHYDVIIIGAGAAGLMAAARAGQRGRSVLVLEHTSTIGAKILISGGGRCNFTNLDIRPERFISQNPHFARSALARYTQHDFIALVKSYQIGFYEKTLGQLFCDGPGSARLIVDMLVAECTKVGVTIATDLHIQKIEKAGEGFCVQTSVGKAFGSSLIMACGGLSIPKLGATGLAYEVARQFNVDVIAPMPALVPLVFEGEDRAIMTPLAGVSLEGVAGLGKTAFREGMVFTHRGLSGPVILQISSYWEKGASIKLNLVPDVDCEAWLIGAKSTRPRAQPATILAERLPSRLAHTLAEHAGLTRPMADQKDADLKDLAKKLQNWQLTPSGDEGYAKAEVTRGGIDTNALSQKTMETKTTPGLFFIGEAVDVTGWLGGYNFQWAWSSGVAAGEVA
jgi:predicted Rossmann fold flavoprotein